MTEIETVNLPELADVVQTTTSPKTPADRIAALTEIPASGINVLIAYQQFVTATTSALIDFGVKRTAFWMRVPMMQRDVQLELSGVHVEN